MTLLRWVRLRVPVTAPASTRSTKPSDISSVWTPRWRWSASSCEDLVRDRADPRLERRPVGDPLGDELGDPAVGVAASAGSGLDERVVGLAPAVDLADVDLVLAVGARHLRVRPRRRTACRR